MELNPKGSEQTSELLQAQTHIWNHMFSFINSMSLNCAIQLEIFDIINRHGKKMSVPELVNALKINEAKAPCVFRLTRILAHSGFLMNSKDVNKESEEFYTLTPSSKLLVKDEALSVRPFYLAMLDPILVSPWQYLSQWFGNDDLTPFVTGHGKALWEFASNDGRFSDVFNKAMASDTELVKSVVIRECKGVFEGIGSLVDVGGGTGTVAMAIVEAFPDLRCTVFDLPHVVDKLQGSKNLSFVGGSLFEPIPHADAVFLKWTLHAWNDEDCLKILRRCKEAIPSKENGGKVIIIDIVVDSHKEDYRLTQTQLFFDMLMMVIPGGKERTEKEWKELFKAAGFSDYKINPILGSRSLIEVFP